MAFPDTMVDPPSSRLTMLSSLRCMYLGWCKGTVSRLSTSGIHVLNTSVPMPASLMTNICCRTVLMKVSLLCVLLCLLWSLVEVHSQTPTAPYLTFNDSVIPSNSYVDLSLMMYPGNDDTTADISSTVICHTDLDTCCGGADGHGEWYFPNGTVLRGAGPDNVNQYSIAIRRQSTQRVRLQRGPVSTAISPIPSGIYRCDIETVAVSDQGGTGREAVYVGIYESGGTFVRVHVYVIWEWATKNGC